MAELKQLEFFLLRYSPYAVREDSVTFGLILLEASHESEKFAEVRFTSNWRPVRCLDPGADLEYLEALERDIRKRLKQPELREDLLRTMRDSFSSLIRISAATPLLGEDPTVEMEVLAKQYLEIPRRNARLEPSGRQRILRKMQDAFEQAGIWKMIKREIPIEEYTFKGDPLKIDVSYQPNGVVKMFQAVSLAVSVDPAKVLAFTYPQVAEGIAKREKIGSSLTAIIEDDLDRNHAEINFALMTMEKSGIQVAVAAEMPLIAERARIELRA